MSAKYFDFSNVDFNKYSDYKDLQDFPFSFKFFRIDDSDTRKYLKIVTKITARNKDVMVKFEDREEQPTSFIGVELEDFRDYYKSNKSEQYITLNNININQALVLIDAVKKDIENENSKKRSLTEEEFGYYEDLNKFLNN